MGVTAAVGHTVRFYGHQKPDAEVALQKRVGQGVGLLRSLTLLVKMKGHVGGGSGSRRLQGVGYSVKAKSFSQVLHVSIRKNICAERLLEMSGSVRAFHLAVSYINLRV